MSLPDVSESPDESSGPAPRDSRGDRVETMRGAIRAVAAAHRLRGEVRRSAAQRRADREQRAADRERRERERAGRGIAPPEAGPTRDPGKDEAGSPDATLATARARLHEAVAAYVRDRRVGGDPAERVLVHLKGVLRDAFDAGESWEVRRDLGEEVVSLAIKCYYRPA